MKPQKISPECKSCTAKNMKACIKLMEIAKDEGRKEGMKIKISEIYKQSDPEIDLLKTAQNNFNVGCEKGRKEEKERILKKVDKWYKLHCKNHPDKFTFACMPDTLDELKKSIEGKE